jgi:O-antigen ligase
MKRLWLLYFPLLFLPNFGFSKETAFGVLEVSDWLILPFLILLLAVPAAKYTQLVSRQRALLWTFAGWALLSTLSIHFRYDYLDDVPILLGCCVKLARLVLYVVTGILITKRLSDASVRRGWAWSLMGALCMLSLGLLVSAGGPDTETVGSLTGYKSYNAIVVSVAILSAYVAGLWIDNVFGRKWNRCASIALLFAVCSVLLSTGHATRHGRGGWVGLAAGLAYIFYKRTANLKILGVITLVGVASFTAYQSLPTFKSFVDMTLSNGTESSSLGVDDGGRLSTWGEEAPKFVRTPLLGTGFYHRGGESGLWASGSHNFFIQMFLETGSVGGILVILFFCLAWRQAGGDASVRNKVQLATRAALVAAVVGGMSGEYYYGGIGVLVLFASQSLTGSLPTSRLASAATRAHFDSLRWRAAS